MKNNLRTLLYSLFISKTNNFLPQFLRYTFVGGFAFLIDFGTLFVLTEYFSVYYLVSAGISFLLGLLVNYFISINWVFDNRIYKNHFFEFLVFTLIGVIGLFLNEFFIWFFTEKFLMYYLLSKITAAIIVYLWNFIARKFILFDKKLSNNG